MCEKMEKRQRIEHISRVDIDLVNCLMMIRLKRNFDLQGTGLYCNLRPNKSREACKTCTNYKKCAKAKNERVFIQQHKKAVSCKRRRRKQDNPKKRIDPDWINEQTETNDVPFYEDESELAEIEELCRNLDLSEMEDTLSGCLL